MTKQKVTREQYVKWLNEFKRIRNDLVKLDVNISSITGKTKARNFSNKLIKIEKQLSELKWEMENKMLEDHPEGGILGY